MIAIIAIVLYIIDFSQIIISNAVGDDYLVLEVMFERNAAHHDGGELHVIQCTDAGIRSEIPFYNFFAIQPMPAANPVRVAASMMVVTSLLLSDMVAFDIRKNNSLKQIYLSLSRYVIHAKETVFLLSCNLREIRP